MASEEAQVIAQNAGGIADGSLQPVLARPRFSMTPNPIARVI